MNTNYFQLTDEEAERLSRTCAYDCPHCGGKNWVEWNGSGIPCLCWQSRLASKVWSKVDKVYRDCRLNSLRPFAGSAVPEFIQADIAGTLQQSPATSYLFVGPAKTSKTWWSMCLLQRAVTDWMRRAWDKRDIVPPQAVWLINAVKLVSDLDAFSTWERRWDKEDHAEPKLDISIKQVQRAIHQGYRPCLYLEELDKIPVVTANRGSLLFTLINLIDSNGGQLVATSNRTIPELEQKFAEVDGAAFIRRFTENNATESGRLYDLHQYVAK